ncbi:unnamed protein product [Brassica rapa]|uniref:50S ribosomal protein L35 n=3 Tax=Brassica TaxID=3705 RepID=A0A3P6B2L3_BRACM|nr:uncharacterized protein BNAA02G24030D [Brassica napus]CAF2142275.1 unnamed protein product [Brassica napus]CAG7894709.1 unnamed protein product [Brassica rapa]CDY26367.1 BnaA02g24030D [Brassica napus]VDC90711.1 unnamed protein product [Brassica rapa]
MQRFCTKLRSISLHSNRNLSFTSVPHRLIHHSRSPQSTLGFATTSKKKWRPRTPITSKVKKVKIKFYSSYKDRFRPLNDGTIRRWKEGKRHNAHLKSKKSKRRLRQPGLVPPAYAKVMKKLNFCN